ncbi:hypothetical protein KKH24_04200, partial [Patescibacteria group bacterium]|nr:hypothetical protein [Patescibacteria group bacterium]
KFETMKIFMENKEMIDAIATDEFWKSTRFLFELFFKSKNSQSKQIVGVMRIKYTEGKVESEVLSASEGLNHIKKVLECLPSIEGQEFRGVPASYYAMHQPPTSLEEASEKGELLSKDMQQDIFSWNGYMQKYVEVMVKLSLDRVVDFIDQFPHVLTPEIVETYTKDITDLWLAYSTGSSLIVLETPIDIQKVRRKMKQVVRKMKSSK